jgi:hypothetical protein
LSAIAAALFPSPNNPALKPSRPAISTPRLAGVSIPILVLFIIFTSLADILNLLVNPQAPLDIQPLRTDRHGKHQSCHYGNPKPAMQLRHLCQD